jgi:uncharacterized protein with von Willebrand factor type A (vWA) domain
MNELELKCFQTAEKMISSGLSNLDLFELTELLIKLDQERNDKNALSDSNIDYNDEIVEIVEMGELETVNIGVSGDNLFYCNNILTKNSFGTMMTADIAVALIKTEELDNLGQVMFKQIRNRDNDVSKYKRFVVGVDRNKMRLYDVEQSAQVEALDEALDAPYEYEETTNKKDKFSKFKY